MTPKLWASKGSFTPLLQLKKFPDLPVSTREEARESRAHPEEPRFRLLARRRDPFPACKGKNSRSSGASQEEALSTGKVRRTQGSCHHFQSTPNVSVHSGETCFPCNASTFKPRIESHLGGTWDSPVGKPRGKATDPLIHAKGSVILLQQLGRKAHVHAPTRDED